MRFWKLFSLWVVVVGLVAQEALPRDRHWDSAYHPYPYYRESESHPLRVAGYILHPVGWALRESIFRPLSYFASKSQMNRSVMGYRFDGDFAYSSCLAVTVNTDCRVLAPFKGSSAK